MKENSLHINIKKYTFNKIIVKNKKFETLIYFYVLKILKNNLYC